VVSINEYGCGIITDRGKSELPGEKIVPLSLYPTFKL
jgi:hypothetical protein